MLLLFAADPMIYTAVGGLVTAVLAAIGALIVKVWKQYRAGRTGNVALRIQERKDIVDHQGDFINDLQNEMRSMRREMSNVRKEQQALAEREARCERERARQEERLNWALDKIKSMGHEIPRWLTDDASGLHTPLSPGEPEG